MHAAIIVFPCHLTALQTIVPLLPLPQTNFTATSGERVTLHCPIQPGALLQQYTVRWKKDETTIAELTNSMRVVTIDDSRYQIDRATYSLIIDPVNISDTNSNYQCEIFVTNPQSLTPTRRMLQPSPSVTLSLKVNS